MAILEGYYAAERWAWTSELAPLAPLWTLEVERLRGRWPDCFDGLWAKLTERYGPSEAARQMVDVLLLARPTG